MNGKSRQPIWNRSEQLQLLSLSATLAGLSITAVTLLHALPGPAVVATIADDLLAFSALTFLVCCFLFFFCLRTSRAALAMSLEKLADGLLLPALSGMVGSGFVMVYTLI